MKWFFIVLFLDAFKGYLPVSIMMDSSFIERGALTSIIPVLCAVAALLGHSYPIFLNFKGGKGVATGLGVFFALAPIPMFAALIVFLVMLFMFGYISVGSITAAIMLPCFVFILEDSGSFNPTLFMAIAGCAFIIYKHMDNIKRLLAGTENKFEFKKKEEKK